MTTKKRASWWRLVVIVAAHRDGAPESIFANVWKQGPALDLAKGLRFALDVEVGAAKVASNSGRE